MGILASIDNVKFSDLIAQKGIYNGQLIIDFLAMLHIFGI